MNQNQSLTIIAICLVALTLLACVMVFFLANSAILPGFSLPIKPGR